MYRLSLLASVTVVLDVVQQVMLTQEALERLDKQDGALRLLLADTAERNAALSDRAVRA